LPITPGIVPNRWRACRVCELSVSRIPVAQ
jgi:hypothetical protein